MQYFSGAVCIVTGGASGIGYAICAELARYGAIVMLTDIDAGAAEKAAAAIAKEGGRVLAAALDVTDRESYGALVGRVLDRHGRIDFLFNVAGIGLNAELRDTTPALWKKVIDVNLNGVFNGISLVYPRMIERGGGHIVTIASAYALMPFPLMGAYAASKHAVMALSSILWMEAREHGIQVTTVCPANIDTPHHRNLTNIGYDQADIASMDKNRMSAARCATITLKGVARRKKLVVMQASLCIPWLLYRLLPRLTMRAFAGPVYSVLKKDRLPRKPASSEIPPQG